MRNLQYELTICQKILKEAQRHIFYDFKHLIKYNVQKVLKVNSNQKISDKNIGTIGSSLKLEFN